MATLIAILGGIGSIYGLWKLAIWSFRSTPEADKEKIDRQVDEDEKKTVETGRP